MFKSATARSKKKWLTSHHRGGSSWNDPHALSLKVFIAMTYMACLAAFQRLTRPNDPVKVAIGETSMVSKSRIMRALLSVENVTEEVMGNSTHANATEGEAEADPMFPKDLFTMEQIKSGAVGFYIFGVMYMFVALAIVCDEFFVPALDVMIEKLGISEDVAGATFMAAGGSAPELFTSVIGVFIAFSDVGIGTIVGSAVFNILFVIGMCALFSKEVLRLTWWPLLRDCTFYSVSLITLILFFMDEVILWWESLGLLGIYASYVYFMKFNVSAELGFKKLIGANKVQDQAAANGQGHLGYTGVPVLHSGSHFHHGIMTLMIHTIDPLTDAGKVDEKAAQLHAIASLQNMLGAAKNGDGMNGNNSQRNTNQGLETSQFDAFTNADQLSAIGVPYSLPKSGTAANTDLNGGLGGEEEEENAPLDLGWPDTWSKRFTYVFVLPLIIPMWLTLPDTRKPELKKFFAVTFIGSILWIAAFSYLMVWWATITGNAFDIPPEVMGLTFLAAGTSIPDLFTSVIVARKGFGDMAVSSSVGSNIFDVTVGLPLPWFLYCMVFQQPVPVSSEGMVCSITLLFMMLMLVFLSILLFGWKMTKGMGFSMFVFYFIFVIITLGFEYDWYECPL